MADLTLKDDILKNSHINVDDKYGVRLGNLFSNFYFIAKFPMRKFHNPNLTGNAKVAAAKLISALDQLRYLNNNLIIRDKNPVIYWTIAELQRGLEDRKRYSEQDVNELLQIWGDDGRGPWPPIFCIPGTIWNAYKKTGDKIYFWNDRYIEIEIKKMEIWNTVLNELLFELKAGQGDNEILILQKVPTASDISSETKMKTIIIFARRDTGEEEVLTISPE